MDVEIFKPGKGGLWSAWQAGQLQALLRALGVQCCIPGMHPCISFPSWDHGDRPWHSPAGWSFLPVSRLTCPILCLDFLSVRLIF